MTKLYNLKLYKGIRRVLRKESVRAERKLWSKIRMKQLGYKFRRQFGINNYIVDFYCPELKFAIEVDGAYHSSDEEIAYDEKREKYLNSIGIKVKRYGNSDIYKNINGVLEDISDCCKNLSQEKNNKIDMK